MYKSKFTLSLIFLVLVSCLVPAPPKYYDYFPIKANNKSNSLDFNVEEATFRIDPSGEFLNTSMLLKIINIKNVRHNVFIHKFELLSKHMDFDSLVVKRINPNVELLNENDMVIIESSDTLKIFLQFFNSKMNKKNYESKFLKEMKNDTLVLNLKLNNKQYNFKFKPSKN